MGLVTTPNAAHCPVVTFDGDSPAISSGRHVDAAAAGADANPDASSGDHYAYARLRSPSGRAAIVEIILLANGWRTLDVPAAASARPAAHCNGGYRR